MVVLQLLLFVVVVVGCQHRGRGLGAVVVVGVVAPGLVFVVLVVAVCGFCCGGGGNGSVPYNFNVRGGRFCVLPLQVPRLLTAVDKYRMLRDTTNQSIHGTAQRSRRS